MTAESIEATIESAIEEISDVDPKFNLVKGDF